MLRNSLASNRDGIAKFNSIKMQKGKSKYLLHSLEKHSMEASLSITILFPNLVHLRGSVTPDSMGRYKSTSRTKTGYLLSLIHI